MHFSPTDKPDPWSREVRREILDDSEDVTYILDRQLRIVYCNPAYDRFALANGGEACVASRVIGMTILDYAINELRPFYSKLFNTCLTSKQMHEFDFECSSPEMYRSFRMHLLPLKSWEGMLVINSKRIEFPHQPGVSAAPPSEYLNQYGIATLCAHCRRAKKIAAKISWDLVPSLIDGSTPLSHGLCPLCVEYMYRLEMSALPQSGV